MDRERKWRWIGSGAWPLLLALVAMPLGAWFVYVSFAEEEFPLSVFALESPATAEELSIVTVVEIQRQLRYGTIGRFSNGGSSWSSQPGAIRTFSTLDETGELHKLYSAAEMRVEGDADLSVDVPVDWDTQPDQFVDLNAPTTIPGGKLVFPIADPRAFSGSDHAESAEGFSYSADINGVVGPDPSNGSADSQRLPMPVRWRYVLKRGEVGTLDEQNQWVGEGNASESNPIVGRIAYWTDDLSCKINVNTASEGVYWDTPRADTLEERDYATIQPARNEFQRQPGHPAQVSLSSVLFPNRRYYLPGMDGDLDPLTLAEAERLWRIAPGVGTNGSKGGTRRIAGDEAPMVADPADYHLYESLEDVASSNPTLPAPVEQRLSRGQFLLTTDSNAPEADLHGTPRIAMWPVPALQGERSSFDQKVAEAATLGGVKYFFQRENASELHREFYIVGAGNNALVNQNIDGLSNRVFPGFPNVSFNRKYGRSVFDEWAQINLAVFGYVRGSNLFDPTSPSPFTLTSAAAGHGQVSAICEDGSAHTERWYKKFSPYPIAGARSFSISEIGLVFIVSGYVDPAGNAFGDSEALTPGQRRFEVGLVLETFCPTLGVTQIRPLARVVGTNSTSGGVIDKSPIPMRIDAEDLEMVAFESSANNGADLGGSGGIGMFTHHSDGSGLAWSRSGNPEKQFIVSGETMNLESMGSIGIGFELLVYDTLSEHPDNIWQVITYRPLTGIGDVVIPSPQLPQDLSTIGTWDQRLAAAGSDSQAMIREGDVVRSSVVRCGDSRLIQAKRVSHGGTSNRYSFIPHEDFFDSSEPMSHHLVDRHGEALYGAKGGRELVEGANYAPEIRPDFSAIPGSPEYLTLEIPTPSSAPDPSVTGDFDTGLARNPDGAYTNHPDAGVYFPDGVPYFDHVDDTARSNTAVFSPQRIMPGPGMLGSLSTGIQEGIPWRTLLFRPDPDHFGSTEAPDHLLLDQFWMPVLEPRAISHDYSTDGKINMNYAIAPFSHIRRATAMHALLKAEKMMAIPLSAASFYKTQISDVKWRHYIDTEETLLQFEERFEQGDFFRSASEICEQYLVPEGGQLGAKVSGDYPAMSAFWETHKLTGDNVKERPYTNLQTRLTTKSNHFKIHAIVQPITKDSGSDQNGFDSASDTLGDPVPFSATMRRLLDGTPDCADFNQENTGFPNYLQDDQGTFPAVDEFYRYSVVGMQPELRAPIEIGKVTRADGEVTLGWWARGSDVFVVERSTDLIEWEVIAPNFGGSTPWTEFVDTSPPADLRAYYRVSRR